ncbi:MAG: HDOD domain-containing protein [Phycisphaerales bacterium]
MAALNDAIAALERLPAMPATSLQLISLLAGGGHDANLAEVERIIRRDEAVAAAVLRRANSAAFSLPGRIYGLSEAIRRLGARNLCRIAFESQASSYLAEAGRAYGLRRGALSPAALTRPKDNSVGLMLVYATEAEARAAYPDAQIIEVREVPRG